MKYRKKPVVIEAVQWDGSHKSTKEILKFMGQEVNLDNDISQKKFDEYVSICTQKGMHIETLEGKMTASIGDYIIRGVHVERQAKVGEWILPCDKWFKDRNLSDKSKIFKVEYVDSCGDAWFDNERHCASSGRYCQMEYLVLDGYEGE